MQCGELNLAHTTYDGFYPNIVFYLKPEIVSLLVGAEGLVPLKSSLIFEGINVQCQTLWPPFHGCVIIVLIPSISGSTVFLFLRVL